MLQLLTRDAVILCDHKLGVVGLVAGQHLVTIEGRPVLVESDPETRPIVGCPNAGGAFVPCTATLPVLKGYSDLLRIDHRRVCLRSVTGLTNGQPQGSFNYSVASPGQSLVNEL